MITSTVQRWRHGRSVYRPVGEPLVTSRYDVTPIDDDTTARMFVERHHYSRSYPAARRRFGLYELGQLVGVAVFSQPANNATLACLGCPTDVAAELGRFVLLDRVPANGESWFLARCFDALRREGFAGLVSFSDPTPRTDAQGAMIFRGHLGIIYQATNAVYLGRARAEAVRLLPDGSVLHNRSLAKLRKRDKGWRYVAARLASFPGRFRVPALDDREDPYAYLVRWLPVLVRPLPHAGNHKYAFALGRGMRKHLPSSLPYPKVFAPL